VVQAHKQASANYLIGSVVTQTISIAKALQSLSFTSTVPTLPVAGQTYTLAATATSGLAPSYSVASGTCTISGAVVSFTASGTCVVRASQVGDTRFEAATPVTQTIGIGSRNQTLTFNAATNAITSKVYGSAAFSVVAESTESEAIVT
jgi:hypothetical protein